MEQEKVSQYKEDIIATTIHTKSLFVLKVVSSILKLSDRKRSYGNTEQERELVSMLLRLKKKSINRVYNLINRLFFYQSKQDD